LTPSLRFAGVNKVLDVLLFPLSPHQFDAGSVRGRMNFALKALAGTLEKP
jgi:hypothetical protein